MPKTMVIIPTYNEAENIERLTEALLALPVSNLSILIVDDNSPDGTGDIADGLAAAYPGQVAVLHRQGKGGLGPAYIAGFKEAIARDADYIIQMDADFSHQPHYIPELIAKLEQGCDMVIGSRYAPGGGVDTSWGPYRKLLSWFANRVYVRYLLWIPVRDATGGYRIWRRNTLIGIDLDRVRSNGYVFQVETTYITCRLGFRVGEIPIYFPDRQEGISKMNAAIPFEAALRVWQVMVRHRKLQPGQRRTHAYTDKDTHVQSV